MVCPHCNHKIFLRGSVPIVITIRNVQFTMRNLLEGAVPTVIRLPKTLPVIPNLSKPRTSSLHAQNGRETVFRPASVFARFCISSRVFNTIFFKGGLSPSYLSVLYHVKI